ncbi:MAG: hypothetical protein JWM10_29 [Myxococcaceae bacterium]|nr:hypothetical protein [Myxococcaceae bacterium]
METPSTPARTDPARWLPAALAALTLTLRLPFLAPIAQDPDGARFVRALLRYDLTQGHPHPPGYPLYLALGAALHRLGPSPALSLSLVSALSLAALVALFTRWCIPRTGALPAALGAVLLAVAPLSTVLSARPLSDALGAALAWGALLSATRAAPDARRTAVLSALVLLARVSAFALCAPALVAELVRDRRHRAAAVAAFALTLALGYAPVLALTGPVRLARLVLDHGAGHFERFGGSVVTHPALGPRARAFAFALWTHCLGGGWTDRPAHLYAAGAALAFAALIGLRALSATPDRATRLVALCAAVYALWIFLGQNILWSPRHLLPLLPALAWCVSTGAAALLRRRPRLALAALVLALGSLSYESLRLSRTQRRDAPPTVALARWIDAHTDAPHAVIATAQLGAWLRGLTPSARVVDVIDARDVAALRLSPGDRLFVTSEVRDASTLGGRVRARFVRDRYVNPALYDLAIIELPR